MTSNKMDLFEANKYQILTESMEQFHDISGDIAQATVNK